MLPTGAATVVVVTANVAVGRGVTVVGNDVVEPHPEINAATAMAAAIRMLCRSGGMSVTLHRIVGSVRPIRSKPLLRKARIHHDHLSTSSGRMPSSNYLARNVGRCPRRQLPTGPRLQSSRRAAIHHTGHDSCRLSTPRGESRDECCATENSIATNRANCECCCTAAPTGSAQVEGSGLRGPAGLENRRRASCPGGSTPQLSAMEMNRSGCRDWLPARSRIRLGIRVLCLPQLFVARRNRMVVARW